MKVFRKKPDPIPFTQTGFDALLSEQNKLLGERPDAVEHLRKAREMGDLRENGYYKASRQRLSFLDSRLRRLERLIKHAHIVEKTTGDSVEIGSSVTGKDNLEKSFTYTIVGGYESNPAQGTISYLSPLGKALMGHKAGDTVTVITPLGKRVYFLVSIS